MDVYKNKQTDEIIVTNEKLDEKDWKFIKKIGEKVEIKNQMFNSKKSIKL